MTDDKTLELEQRDKIPDATYRVLLDLYMVSDPWPLSSQDAGIMLGLLDAEAHKRGYDTWVEAYHELEVDDD